jgi:hypothetical protein
MLHKLFFTFIRFPILQKNLPTRLRTLTKLSFEISWAFFSFVALTIIIIINNTNHNMDKLQYIPRFYQYIFSKKYWIKKIYGYNFFAFPNVLGWHAPLLNASSRRHVGSSTGQIHMLLGLVKSRPKVPRCGQHQTQKLLGVVLSSPPWLLGMANTRFK